VVTPQGERSLTSFSFPSAAELFGPTLGKGSSRYVRRMLEWLWRTVTYGRRQPLRRETERKK